MFHLGERSRAAWFAAPGVGSALAALLALVVVLLRPAQTRFPPDSLRAARAIG